MIQGIIDLHYHSGPDVKKRKLNDLELMEQGVAIGARGVVIKTHFSPTAGRAALVNQIRNEKYPKSDFELFGGIALNRSAGGLNPYALETELKMGARVVWLPTVDSENEFRKAGKSGGIRLVENGKAVPELMPILELIRDYDVCLQTGHASGDECFPIVEAARHAGVQKIVITHPEYHIVGMTPAQQEQIVRDYGVYLEREFAQPVGDRFVSNLASNVEAIRAIGAEHIILASDSGQVNAPLWRDAVRQSIDYYRSVGIRESDLRKMMISNPGKVLGLEPTEKIICPIRAENRCLFG